MPVRKPEIDAKAAEQHAANINEYVRWAFPDGFELHEAKPGKPEEGIGVSHYSLHSNSNLGTHATALRQFPIQVTVLRPRDKSANVMLGLQPHPQHPESSEVLKRLAKLLKPST